MKSILLSVLILAPGPALAQTKPGAPAASAAGGKCDKLARQWKGIEYSMADRNAESVGDNSAPRATLRAMEESNDLARASMLLQFMRDNRCTLPSSPPSYITYVTPALKCRTARLEGKRDDPACNYEAWTRMGD